MIEHRYATDDLDRRLIQPYERVTGLAVPYEAWETIGAETVNGRTRRRREKVRRGAFNKSIQSADAGEIDIRAFMAHEPERILGRTANGTLRLRDTAEGLMFDLDLPDTTDARDARSLIERGDLGASIGFLRRRDGKIEQGEDDDGMTHWEVLLDVDLREISLTANPAYKSTFVRLAQGAAIEAATGRSEALEWLYGLPTPTEA